MSIYKFIKKTTSVQLLKDGAEDHNWLIPPDDVFPSADGLSIVVRFQGLLYPIALATNTIIMNQAGTDVDITATGATLIADSLRDNIFNVFSSSQGGNLSQSALTLTNQAAGTVNSIDLINVNNHGAHFAINITAITGSVVINIQAKDPISGAYYLLLASASLSTTGMTVLKIFPGLVALANQTADDILPRIFRVQAVITGGPASLTVGVNTEL